MKKEHMKGTHRSMGKTGGLPAGVENGVAEVQKHTAGVGVSVAEKTGRPKAEDGGSIAVGK